MIWPTKKLQDIAKVIDSLHRTPKYQDFGRSMVRVVDIKNTYLDLTETLKVSDQEFAAFNSNHTPKEGDILLTRVGSYGRVAFVKNVDSFCIGQNTVVITGHKFPYFLYCCFRSSFIKEQIESYVGGASQPTVSLASIRALEIPVPDDKTMGKIERILISFDDLIEENVTRIKCLEEMLKQIYREWFSNFKFPTNKKEVMSDIDPTDLGATPEGWSRCKVGDICERIFSGGTPSTQQDDYWNGNFSWLSSGETRERWIIETEKTITKAGIENSSTRLAPRNAVVIASAGQGKTRGQTSLLCLDTYINQSVIALVVDTAKATPLFLHTFFQLNYNALRKISDSSSSRGSLTIPDLKQLDILLPPLELQQKLPAINELIPVLMRQNETLIEMRDLLLPKLISGEIDILEIYNENLKNIISKKNIDIESERIRL